MKPPKEFAQRAVVDNDGDFKRRTWRHRSQPIAVQHSRCLLGGLPDAWRVLVGGAIYSRHRSPRAAWRVASKLARTRAEGAA